MQDLQTSKQQLMSENEVKTNKIQIGWNFRIMDVITESRGLGTLESSNCLLIILNPIKILMKISR